MYLMNVGENIWLINRFYFYIFHLCIFVSLVKSCAWTIQSIGASLTFQIVLLLTKANTDSYRTNFLKGDDHKLILPADKSHPGLQASSVLSSSATPEGSSFSRCQSRTCFTTQWDANSCAATCLPTLKLHSTDHLSRDVSVKCICRFQHLAESRLQRESVGITLMTAHWWEPGSVDRWNPPPKKKIPPACLMNVCMIKLSLKPKTFWPLFLIFLVSLYFTNISTTQRTI